MKTATVKHFYSDTNIGTVGEVIKEWTTPSGVSWAKLFFGKNLTGQKLMKSFPVDVLNIENK